MQVDISLLEGKEIPMKGLQVLHQDTDEVHVGCIILNVLLSPEKTCRVGLVVSVSASHMVGHGFASWLGHTKDHHKNGANCLPALHICVRVGV